MNLIQKGTRNEDEILEPESTESSKVSNVHPRRSSRLSQPALSKITPNIDTESLRRSKRIENRKINVEIKLPVPAYKLLYSHIHENKIAVKFRNIHGESTDSDSDYDECKCRPDDAAPCTLENKCENASVNFECRPERCPAGVNFQNQNFRRGGQFPQFKFEVKKTPSKGWGLYTQEEIPANKFIIEYMGEIIDQTEFLERFSHLMETKAKSFYFMNINKNFYIDARVYGNESRFINHSCEPNAEIRKWTVLLNHQKQVCIGIFASRNILPVRKYRIREFVS